MMGKWLCKNAGTIEKVPNKNAGTIETFAYPIRKQYFCAVKCLTFVQNEQIKTLYFVQN